MNNKKVSIIVPVYNVENYLERCVNSIINQTYKNLEIILINDGSSDNSPKICDKFAEQDKRVKVVHKENGGVSSARNKGLDIATGDYVEFVDSDDYIEPNCVETLVNKIQDNDLVICGYNLKNNKNTMMAFEEESVLDFRINQKQFFKAFKQFMINSPCNKLYKKELITTEFDVNYSLGEDTLFNLQYLKKCSNVALIKEVLYNYNYLNENSLVHTKVNTLKDFKNYWNEIFKFSEDYFKDSNYIKELNAIYIKATMSQVINICLKNEYKYNEFKKVFNTYRNLEKIKLSLRNFNNNAFTNNKFYGKILTIIFKLKLKPIFYIVLKKYKKKKLDK